MYPWFNDLRIITTFARNSNPFKLAHYGIQPEKQELPETP